MSKSRTALHETGEKGAFVRKDSVFRDWIEEGGKLPPECEALWCLTLCFPCMLQQLIVRGVHMNITDVI